MTDTKRFPYEEALRRLLGGDAEPVGDSAIDAKKLEIQKIEQDLIDMLITDIYECLNKVNAYWSSGQVAGKLAREYLKELKADIDRWLSEYGETE